jgi:hypothetical protein
MLSQRLHKVAYADAAIGVISKYIVVEAYFYSLTIHCRSFQGTHNSAKKQKPDR